ncbi:D-glycerate dehydrogenase [Candidatus Bathyarchaeota archaeon]|nr:MAG: D-glycerate dehydrogenase [Candidatus Bathyarchaeota archaeon]
MSKPKVYVTRQLFDEALGILERHAEVEVFDGVDNPAPRDLILSKVREVDGLLCLLTDKIDSEVIEAGRNLKVISNYAVGFNNIDVEAATRHGIYVTNTPGILTETTADCAWALLLAIARRIAEADRSIRAGKWVHAWGPRMFLGSDVHGKTLGIVGLGRIGSAVAKRAKGFDMNVIYYDVRRREDLEEKLGITFKSLEEVLSEADFVTVHVPLTKGTYHMIGRRELSMMKKSAYLINTSRGPVIDEAELYSALKEGVIAGAALDVFEQEPLDPNSPLLELENVVLTPHIASASVETRTKMAVVAATNLVSVLRGEEPPNLVNPEVKKIRPLRSQ